MTLALEIGWGTTLAIKTLIVMMIIPLGALILGYVFLLKMMSHMQSRLGPMDPGGFHGWFQLVGDGIKFLQKEDIMPAESDRRVFALAPAIASTGDMSPEVAGASLIALVPALGGMFLGQALRTKIGPAVFRRAFFGGLLLLGCYLATKPLL